VEQFFATTQPPAKDLSRSSRSGRRENANEPQGDSTEWNFPTQAKNTLEWATRRDSEYTSGIKKGAAMPHDEEWRILAEEAVQEKDPQKLLEIVKSLTAAIDKEQSKKTQQSQKKTQPPTAPAA
jgi:hypothetical protein